MLLNYFSKTGSIVAYMSKALSALCGAWWDPNLVLIVCHNFFLCGLKYTLFFPGISTVP
jgi:hypothetical protein